MNRSRPPHHPPSGSRRRALHGWAALALALGGCDGPQSTLEANGPDAAAIADLYWVLVAISTVVCLVVVGLMTYALLRRRHFRGEPPPLRLTPRSAELRERRLRGERDPDSGEPLELTESDDEPLEVMLDTAESDRRSVRWLLIGSVLVPAVILTGTFLYTLGVHGRLEAGEASPELTIEVVGWQWWWEVLYRDEAGRPLFETANEIHIPVGRRVRFLLRSADVIHSFWVPQLAGKMDMIPGRTTRLTLRADRAGVYRGQCAEYCEEQHAHMSFLVIAQPEAEYRAWAANQARDEPEVTDSLARRGREVFLGTACAACHAVRGTPAVGNLGPDLTHLATRRTLGALTVPNTRGHLGGWVSNPHKVKPAVRMPAVPLRSDELIALLRYLESLK